MTYMLPTDKLTHYVVGSLVTLLVLPLGAGWAFGACLVAAVGRELWGAFRADNTVDPADIFATVAGGLVVLAGAWCGLAPRFHF